MQVYRGLPILTNQSARETELVAIWDLDHEASVGEYAELAHGRRSAPGRGTTPVVVGGTGSPPRGGAGASISRLRPSRVREERWEAEYDRLGGRPRTSSWWSGIPRQPRACTRTTAVGSSGRRVGERAPRRAERRAAVERGAALPDARRRPRGAEGCPRRANRDARRQMFESGVEEEVRAHSSARSRPRHARCTCSATSRSSRGTRRSPR